MSDWRDDALCAQTYPDGFFPEKGDNPREAKRLCGRCPVSAQCLEFALSMDVNPPGVWGGLSREERRLLRVVAA